MKTADEIDILEAKVRGLENELRRLRQSQLDTYYAAALTGLLSRGWQPFDMAVAEAWKIAESSLKQRAAHA